MDAINAYLDGLATKLDNIRTSCNAVFTDNGYSPVPTLYDLPPAIEHSITSVETIDTLLGSGVIE